MTNLERGLMATSGIEEKEEEEESGVVSAGWEMSSCPPLANRAMAFRTWRGMVASSSSVG